MKLGAIGRMVAKIKIFLGQVNEELKKVTWSSREELIGAVSVVIVATILMAAYIGFADFIITKTVNLLLH